MSTEVYPEVPFLQQDLINYDGAYPSKGFDFVLGSNSSVNNVRVDLWEGPTGTYVFPPAGGIQMRVVSTSANDTLAGTGAQVVHIHYLDNTYAMQEVQINLNGTTPVNTIPTNILRINGFHVIQAGTGGTSAGNISLQNTAGTVTYGYIVAGFNSAQQAIYTIPAGKTGYVSHWQCSSGTSTGNHFTRFYLRTTSHLGSAWPVFLSADSYGTQNNGGVISFPIPFKIPATCDVKVSAISDAGGANAICQAVVMGWFE